jgi:hypothetical protein
MIFILFFKEKSEFHQAAGEFLPPDHWGINLPKSCLEISEHL